MPISDDHGNVFPDEGDVALVGPHGEELMTNDPTDESIFGAFGPAVADFIHYGVVNGAFQIGPANPAANIDAAANPLGYWTGPHFVSGSSMHATWEVVSLYPSGRALRMHMSPGAAGDEIYFQQIVPIGGSYSRTQGYVARLATGLDSGTGAAPFLALQLLDADGGAVGASTEFQGLFSVGRCFVQADADSDGSPPANAARLRIRIGLRRTGAANLSAWGDFTDVRVERGYKWVVIGETNDPATYSAGTIIQYNGDLNFAPNYMSPAVPSGSLAPLRVRAGGIMVYSYIDIREGSAPATPSTAFGRLYVDSSGNLHIINDAGVDTSLGAGGGLSVTTKGDLQTYSTAAARLAVGANNTLLVADSAETTGLKWTDDLVVDTLLANGALTLNNRLRITGYIEPTISANTNDWAPAGIQSCTMIFLSVSGSTRTLSGIDVTGFAQGDLIYVTLQGPGSGGQALSLLHNNSGSSADNRFSLIGGATMTVSAGGGFILVRRGSRWQVLAATA